MKIKLITIVLLAAVLLSSCRLPPNCVVARTRPPRIMCHTVSLPPPRSVHK